MDLYAALDRYLVQLQADGRSEHTRKQIARHVRALGRWLAADGHPLDVGEVTEEDLARFLCSDAATKRPDGRPKRVASVNALRSSLRVFFGFLQEAGVIAVTPARLVRMAHCSPPPPRALRDHEEEKLRAALAVGEGHEAERDRVLFELLLATGVRLSSALALDVPDLDLEEGVVHLRTVKRGGEQVAFVPGQARELLGKFVGERKSGPLFCSASGRRISARHAQRRFRAWRERAGLPATVTCHGMRHAFAGRLYRQTGDVLLVRQALGHRSIVSTLVYTSADSTRLRSAVLSQ